MWWSWVKRSTIFTCLTISTSPNNGSREHELFSYITVRRRNDGLWKCQVSSFNFSYLPVYRWFRLTYFLDIMIWFWQYICLFTKSNVAAARKAAAAAAAGNHNSTAAIFDDITASFYMPQSQYTNDHHFPNRPKSSMSKYGNSGNMGGIGHGGNFKSMRSLNGDQQ